MNIWHDIKEDRIKKDDFAAVIEIPKGCKNKYELDKETGMLKLDRVLYTATHYPANYGFIPRTYAGDHDPLDVLVLCQEGMYPLTLVECYPIGGLRMTDSDEEDEKIIGYILIEKREAPYEKYECLKEDRFAYIEEFIILPEYRFKGYGKELMEEAQKWAKERELTSLELNVLNNNYSARAFYEKCGFEEYQIKMRKKI